MKPIAKTIGKVFKVILGILGGLSVGIILSLLLLHLNSNFGLSIPSLLLVSPLITIFAMIVGGKYPDRFAHFAVILTMFISDENDGFNTTLKDFLDVAAYFLGVIALIIGVIFSASLIVFLGMSGIAFFAISVAKENRKRTNQVSLRDERPAIIK